MEMQEANQRPHGSNMPTKPKAFTQRGFTQLLLMKASEHCDALNGQESCRFHLMVLRAVPPHGVASCE